MNDEGGRFGADLRAGAAAVAAAPDRLAQARRSDASHLATVTAMFFGSYVLLVWGPFRSTPVLILLGMALGLALAASVVQLGHPAMHTQAGLAPRARLLIGSFGWSLMSGPWWRQKHNRIHHRHTNAAGRDDDLDAGIFRLSPDQPWRPVHRLQPALLPLAYPLMHLGMVAEGIRYGLTGKVGHRQMVKPTMRWRADALARQLLPGSALFAIAVVWHGPLSVLGVALLVSAVGSSACALVFVVEHTVPITTFTTSPPKDHALHQVASAVDVAPTMAVGTWLAGGLNHHVEHHLFPRAPVTDLPALRLVVRDACQRHGVAYHEYPTWRAAWAEHLRYVWSLSRRPCPAPTPDRFGADPSPRTGIDRRRKPLGLATAPSR